MNIESNHISVCLCTFKRPELLKRLLDRLECQITERLFSYSIVIADNDRRQSAKDVVTVFAATTSIEIVYCVEHEQNIALARNMALKNSCGNFIALIDDDEIPEKDWLYYLYRTCQAHNVDGVLGPIIPYFEHIPPKWVIKGKFFDRPTHNNGYKMKWPETRTGNVLFRREIIKGIEKPFRDKFGTGSEDVDFFRRMISNGKVFVWNNQAAVCELITPVRCTRSYQIRLALLRGGNSLKHKDPYFIRSILKSLIAFPLYCMALPLLLIASHHLFMKYLISACDHSGKILGLFGINPMKERGL